MLDRLQLISEAEITWQLLITQGLMISMTLICSRILIAKTKLTPIKSLQPSLKPTARMTIPRLELRAALLGARLLASTAKEFGLRLKNCQAWSDSKIVLHWLRSAKPTNNFRVDDYIAYIQELLPS